MEEKVIDVAATRAIKAAAYTVTLVMLPSYLAYERYRRRESSRRPSSLYLRPIERARCYTKTRGSGIEEWLVITCDCGVAGAFSVGLDDEWRSKLKYELVCENERLASDGQTECTL